MYSEKVRQLVAELPNRGELAGATHAGEAENPFCGDEIRLELKISDGVVCQAAFRGQGCPAALAGAAAVTEMVEGRSPSAAAAIGPDELLDYLGGLPKHKRHGAEMAVEALRRALAG